MKAWLLFENGARVAARDEYSLADVVTLDELVVAHHRLFLAVRLCCALCYTSCYTPCCTRYLAVSALCMPARMVSHTHSYSSMPSSNRL